MKITENKNYIRLIEQASSAIELASFWEKESKNCKTRIKDLLDELGTTALSGGGYIVLIEDSFTSVVDKEELGKLVGQDKLAELTKKTFYKRVKIKKT